MDSPPSDAASKCPVVPRGTRVAFSLDKTKGGGEGVGHEEGGGRVMSSPATEERRGEEEKEDEGSFGSEGVVVTAPSTPTPAAAGGPDPTFNAASAAGSLRLYCRLCARDLCVDRTATMCGHVFCYKCVHCLLLWFLTF